MERGLEELNKFLKEALDLVNQLSLPNADERKIVETYRNSLRRFSERIEDLELKAYLQKELADEAYNFWGEVELEAIFWDVRRRLPIVTKTTVPKQWFCWDVDKKQFRGTESREIIKETLYLRLYNLIGKFLERQEDGNRILAQQLMDLKNGITLEYNLDDVAEILGGEILIDKAKELSSKLDLPKIEMISLPLEQMLNLASTPYYSVEVRTKLGDKVFLLPANLNDIAMRVRTLLTRNLCQIEEYATQAMLLKTRRCPRDVKEKVRKSFMQRIEEKKKVFRETVASLVTYVDQKLGELKVEDDWWEVEEKFEKVIGEGRTEEKMKRVRKSEKMVEEKGKALNREAILQVLGEGNATFQELEERLIALNYEFSTSELSALITSLRSEGKIKLVPTPQGLKWELSKGP